MSSAQHGSEEELARYRSPEPFESQDGAVPQPPIDPDKPRMRGYPDAVYRAVVQTPDEELAARASYTEPPVAVED